MTATGVAVSSKSIGSSNDNLCDSLLDVALKKFDWQQALQLLAEDLSLVGTIPQGDFFYVLCHVLYSDHESADTVFDQLLEADGMGKLNVIHINNLVTPVQSNPSIEMASWEQIVERMERFLATPHARRVSIEVLHALQSWAKSNDYTMNNLQILIEQQQKALALHRSYFGKKKI